MKRARFRRFGLALAILLALGALGGTAGAEELTVTISGGVMSWNAISFANTYYYRVDAVESVATTATSVNIDAYIDGLIEANQIQNVGEHDLYVEAYNTETFDTLTWMGTYVHLHPTLPVVGDVLYEALASSAKYDKTTGLLSWHQRSSLTKYYWYSANDGPSQCTEAFSVNNHDFINGQITGGDIPYAESFKIRLTATKAGGELLETWTKTISYAPTITKIDIDDETTSVGGVESEYVYTGAPIKPAITYVQVKGKALTAGTDYTVSYGANTEVGTGTVVISGKGKYKGSVTIKFTIKAKPPAPIEASISAAGVLSWSAYPGAASYGYGANSHFLFTTALSVNINGFIDDLMRQGEIEIAPTYEVTLEAYDSASVKLQSWSATHSYATTARVDIGHAAVTLDPASAAYTGAPIQPTPKVTYKGATLTAGTDYTVSYANNVDVGVATVTVTGKGKFEGTAVAIFQITAASIADAQVSGVPAEVEYTGAAIEPVPTVTYGGTALTAGTDYAVSYSDNVAPGTAAVAIAGAGNFTGVKTVAFKILAPGEPTAEPTAEPTTVPTVEPTAEPTLEPTPTATLEPTPTPPTGPVQISLCAITVKDQAYTGKALKPAPVVKYNGVTLAKGVDYTVSYRNNKNVGRATLTVKGRGNFTGKQSVSFTIAPKAVSISGVTAGDKRITVKWKAQKKQVSGYQLQYATNKRFSGGKKVKVTGAKRNKRTLAGLKAGTTYYVRLRAWHKAGGKTWYSAWSKAKSVKTK